MISSVFPTSNPTKDEMKRILSIVTLACWCLIANSGSSLIIEYQLGQESEVRRVIRRENLLSPTIVQVRGASGMVSTFLLPPIITTNHVGHDRVQIVIRPARYTPVLAKTP